MNKNYQVIVKKFGRNRVKVNEVLARFTTFKIGGPADLFYEAKTVKEMIKILDLAEARGIPWLILGKGSNLLISDEGFRGLVIKTGFHKFKVYKEKGRFKIIAGAGISLGDLVEKAHELGLAGMEFLVGIPGTLGGAVRGNAGAWRQEIGNLVESVRVWDKSGAVKWLKGNECQFAYRQSRFKKNQEVILEIKLSLRKGDRKKIDKKILAYQESRESQPKGLSAGCVFINPKPKPAGSLIDECGLKGKRIGDAQVSPQHANFIINLNQAKAAEVLALIKLVETEVKRKFGLELEKEIQLVGFD